jgi:hypothetical protein
VGNGTCGAHFVETNAYGSDIYQHNHHTGCNGVYALGHAVVDLYGATTDIHSNKGHGIRASYYGKVNIHLPRPYIRAIIDKTASLAAKFGHAWVETQWTKAKVTLTKPNTNFDFLAKTHYYYDYYKKTILDIRFNKGRFENVEINLSSQHSPSTSHGNLGKNRFQDSNGSIANINADGTFSFVWRDDDFHGCLY